MRDFLFILHLIGMTMAVGTGFSMMALGMATKDMALPDRAKYMLRAFVISKVGAMGFGILLITGVAMAIPTWSSLVTFGLFHLKLTLVVILAVLLGIIQVLIKKAKRENGGPVMAKIPKVGSAMFLTGIATVIVAVLVFH